MDGQFVAGEGVRRGVMFVGEGPGREEEATGRPFVGPSGELLRNVFQKLNFNDYYLTNLVSCRACEAAIDPSTNLPRMKKRRGGVEEIVYKDRVPLPPEINACKARLYEEIYIVDPILIVAVGGTAAEHLLNRSITITRERGNPQECVIPGATQRPVLTDKKKVWGRKIHGTYQLPTEQNEVTYLVLPTIHPSFVLRKGADMGKNSPLSLFVSDIRSAVKIYERYLIEVLGEEPKLDTDVDLTDTVNEEYGNDDDS